jgi:hypothetical protein
MTQPITVTIAHQLGTAEAKRRLAEGFSRMTGQLPGVAGARVEQSWSGDRMIFGVRTLGQSVTGDVDVRETSVEVTIRLPALLAIVADSLRGKLQRAGQLLLTKN